MANWREQTVEDCLEKLRLGSVRKLQTQDYRTSGRFPIIDQGQTSIAGWTDDDSGLIEADLPVIVFGDHTRAFKYLDIPFVRGADGTQVLKPKPGIHPLFFFYALRGINLPSRGYNRHFKMLKESAISLPDEADQINIASALQSVEVALAAQDHEIELLQRCKTATMHQLFTRGLRGEAQKDTEIGPMPTSWTINRIGDLCVQTEQIDLKKQATRLIQYVDVSAVSRDSLSIISAQEYVLENAPSRARKIIRSGDVIFATVRPTLVRAAFVSDQLDDQVCSTAFCVLRANEAKAVGKFLYYLVQRQEFIAALAAIETGASYPAVSDRQVKEQYVPYPAPDEQKEIVAILDAIDAKIDLHRRKRDVLDELFKALLHKLMTGEIRVADLDLSALTPPSAKEAAA